MIRTFTSTLDILPTTLDWLSTTARDVKPSLFINLRASLRALSPLEGCQAYVPREHAFHKGMYVLDRYGQLRPDSKVFDSLRVECIKDWKISAILPQELDQPKLAEDADNIIGAFLNNDNAMDPASKDLDCM